MMKCKIFNAKLKEKKLSRIKKLRIYNVNKINARVNNNNIINDFCL